MRKNASNCTLCGQALKADPVTLFEKKLWVAFNRSLILALSLQNRVVDIRASKFNYKLDKFLAKTWDPLAFTVNARVIPWLQFQLVYAFPLVKFLSWLLWKMGNKRVLFIVPNVVSSFHHNENIVLPSLCPAPKQDKEIAFWMWLQLSVCLAAMAFFCKTVSLFVLPGGPNRGHPAYHSTIIR